MWWHCSHAVTQSQGSTASSSKALLLGKLEKMGFVVLNVFVFLCRFSHCSHHHSADFSLTTGTALPLLVAPKGSFPRLEKAGILLLNDFGES